MLVSDFIWKLGRLLTRDFSKTELSILIPLAHFSSLPASASVCHGHDPKPWSWPGLLSWPLTPPLTPEPGATHHLYCDHCRFPGLAGAPQLLSTSCHTLHLPKPARASPAPPPPSPPQSKVRPPTHLKLDEISPPILLLLQPPTPPLTHSAHPYGLLACEGTLSIPGLGLAVSKAWNSDSGNRKLPSDLCSPVCPQRGLPTPLYLK